VGVISHIVSFFQRFKGNPDYRLQTSPEHPGVRRWHKIREDIAEGYTNSDRLREFFSVLKERPSLAKDREVRAAISQAYRALSRSESMPDLGLSSDDYARLIKHAAEGDPTVAATISKIAVLDDPNFDFVHDGLIPVSRAEYGGMEGRQYISDPRIPSLDHTFATFERYWKRDDAIVSRVKDRLIQAFNSSASDGGLVSDVTYDERSEYFSSIRNEGPASFVGRAIGSDKKSALDALLKSDEAMQELFEWMLDEAGEMDRLNKYSETPGELEVTYEESVQNLRRDYNSIESPDDREVVRRKLVTAISGIENNPALITSRDPIELTFMPTGEYPLMSLRDLDVIPAAWFWEDDLGLGRVLYTLLSHDQALTSDLRQYKKSGAYIKNPNVLHLGNETFGPWSLYWKPEELKKGGLSYSFGDSYYDPNFGDHFEPGKSALMSAVRQSLHTIANQENINQVLEQYSPAFTEVQVNRPLDVEKDLSHMVFIPRSMYGRSVDSLSFGIEQYGETIEKMLSWSEKSNAPLNIVTPWIGNMDWEIDGLLRENEYVQKRFGDRVKLWIPGTPIATREGDK